MVGDCLTIFRSKREADGRTMACVFPRSRWFRMSNPPKALAMVKRRFQILPSRTCHVRIGQSLYFGSVFAWVQNGKRCSQGGPSPDPPLGRSRASGWLTSQAVHSCPFPSFQSTKIDPVWTRPCEFRRGKKFWGWDLLRASRWNWWRLGFRRTGLLLEVKVKAPRRIPKR